MKRVIALGFFDGVHIGHGALLRRTKERAAEIGALVAPVGENWWEYKKSFPSLELYAEDSAHASPAGSDFAAKTIWETIREDARRRRRAF